MKAYIRKSSVLFSMRDYTKAIEAIQEAAEHDTEDANTREIQAQLLKCNQALMTQRAGESEEETLQRAMRDPEVAVSKHSLPNYLNIQHPFLPSFPLLSHTPILLPKSLICFSLPPPSFLPAGAFLLTEVKNSFFLS